MFTPLCASILEPTLPSSLRWAEESDASLASTSVLLQGGSLASGNFWADGQRIYYTRRIAAWCSVLKPITLHSKSSLHHYHFSRQRKSALRQNHSFLLTCFPKPIGKGACSKTFFLLLLSSWEVSKLCSPLESPGELKHQ